MSSSASSSSYHQQQQQQSLASGRNSSSHRHHHSSSSSSSSSSLVPGGAVAGGGCYGNNYVVIPGPRGVSGNEGPRGCPGLQGLPGLNGRPGMRGPCGPQGRRGVTGPTGECESCHQQFLSLTQDTAILTAGANDISFTNETNTDPAVFAFVGNQVQVLRNGHYLLSAKARVNNVSNENTTVQMQFWNASAVSSLICDDQQELNNDNGHKEDLNIVAPYDLTAGTILSLRISSTTGATATDIYWTIVQLRGCRGPTGAQGEVGDTGAQGYTGDVGPTGPPNGPTGEQGETGPQGPTGSEGKVGEQGPTGAAGKDGEDGSVGPTGERGPTGSAFLTCFDGELLQNQSASVCSTLTFANLNIQDNTLIESGNFVSFDGYFHYTKNLANSDSRCLQDQLMFRIRLHDPLDINSTLSHAFMLDASSSHSSSFSLRVSVNRNADDTATLVVHSVSSSVGLRVADDVPFHADLSVDPSAGLVISLEIVSTMVGDVTVNRAQWTPVLGCGRLAPETSTITFFGIL